MHAHSYEDVSAVLRKVLPTSSDVVDHYLSQAVWDQAILESLATFAEEKAPLPSDVRQTVHEFIDQERIAPKFKKRVLFHLDRIPV